MKQRAAQWDQPVLEYVQLSERYLGFQQPSSLYAFTDAGDGHKRVNTITNSFSKFLIAFKIFVFLNHEVVQHNNGME